MPETENPLAADMCGRLELQNAVDAESAPQPSTCCTLRPDVALTEVQLLSDIRAALLERTRDGLRITRIASESLLRLLQAMPDSKWRGLSPHRLARMIGSFDVHPHAIRFRNKGVFRGYECAELQSAFLCHLPTATSRA